MLEKNKKYTFYAKIPGSVNEKYTIEEALRSDAKRGLELFSAGTIEDLDSITANYDSLDDLLESYTEERYGEKIRLYEPVIIVDKHETDKKESYAIYEFVFKDEYKELQDINKIRSDVENYLVANPEELKVSMFPYPYAQNYFRGLCNISTNTRQKHPNISESKLIEYTLNEYFKNDNKKRYREAYFTLKKLDYKRVKKK